MATENETNDPFARDIQRILALRDQGRLTEAEAQQLIGAIRGDDHAGHQATSDGDDQQSAHGVAAAVLSPEPAVRPAQPDAPPSTQPDSSEAAQNEGRQPTPPAQSAGGAAPAAATTTDQPTAVGPSEQGEAAPAPAETAGVRWLTTEMVTADLYVAPVAGLEAPRLRAAVEGASLTSEGSDWRLRYRVEGSSWTVWGLRPERIEVEIPPQSGVVLDVKAGDVRLDGVKHVRGHMLAGDLAIDGAESVDIDMKTGDLDARIRPTSGRHRVISKAGDVEVVLMSGADVNVSADVKLGDLSVSGRLAGERTSHGVGHRFRGTLGSGSAELEVRLAAGDMRVRTEG